jgi:hypothetical protein
MDNVSGRTTSRPITTTILWHMAYGMANAPNKISPALLPAYSVTAYREGFGKLRVFNLVALHDFFQPFLISKPVLRSQISGGLSAI